MLEGIVMEVFKDYAYYYNTFNKDKDYKKEAKQIDDLIKKYGNNVLKIIDFGCGTGKHDIELQKMGYSCTGIDMSISMIDIAKNNLGQDNRDISFFVEDIRTFKAKESYDAVISLFHVISYQITNQDVLSTFSSARRALNIGGLFAFDVWYGPGVLSDKPCVRVKEIENDKDKLIRIARPVMYDKKNIVDVNYEILIIDKNTGLSKMIKEVHQMRYFFTPELEFLLNKSGFEFIDNIDCGTLGKTSYDTWTSYFVAKAI